jgi:hypothetical protein
LRSFLKTCAIISSLALSVIGFATTDFVAILRADASEDVRSEIRSTKDIVRTAAAHGLTVVSGDGVVFVFDPAHVASRQLRDNLTLARLAGRITSGVVDLAGLAPEEALAVRNVVVRSASKLASELDGSFQFGFAPTVIVTLKSGRKANHHP